MRNGNGLISDIALGAAAGLAATWAMGLATTFLYEHEDEEARAKEDRVRGGRTAYEIAAEKIAGVMGRQLSDEERRRFAAGLHWGLGAAAGSAYAAMRGRVPRASAGHGLAFGTAFFGLVDEGANTALGFTPPPRAFPWQAHARGLAGHLVFGLVTETLLSAADRLRPHP
ncbi:MAG TPA: DUF1440 domain-containing protein [Longimicrobiales bacterium]|nr:DUF1440 domain-containing protein [Longimicrobiales bacterium]